MPFNKVLFMVVIFSIVIPGIALSARFVFDASCIPMAGDADWVVDGEVPDPSGAGTQMDRNGQSEPQRFPSPYICGIGADTPETYWTGGYSAWGVELAKSGHWVESIPRNSTLTFGDCNNTQDLSFYDVLVLPEPQLPYNESECIAIRNFVANGGGLFLVANHCGSDRTSNQYDSARVFEEMETALYFGIEFERDPDGEIHDFCDWDELNNRNFPDDPNDPLIHGFYGDVRAIGFHSATGIILHPENNNSVQAHAWRNDEPHGDLNVTVASCEYGSGRVVAIGDSAPADDGTGDWRDVLMNGWSHSTTSNNILFMNASHWLTSPDVPPMPTRTPCPNYTPWPYCEGTATPSAPTATPTPVHTPSTDPIVSIYTNKVFYTGGDDFILTLDIENPGAGRSVDLYIVLQVVDLFFFYPSWSSDVDSQRRYLSSSYASSETIFSFIWPDNAGRIDNVTFWAALLDPATNTLISNYDYTTFSAL
ncbi:hypothetical protein JW979_15415 [bacterium]|nr:hypothetical protein [candidate division CSSED10-310 bacterium]